MQTKRDRDADERGHNQIQHDRAYRAAPAPTPAVGHLAATPRAQRQDRRRAFCRHASDRRVVVI